MAAWLMIWAAGRGLPLNLAEHLVGEGSRQQAFMLPPSVRVGCGRTDHCGVDGTQRRSDGQAFSDRCQNTSEDQFGAEGVSGGLGEFL